MENRTQRLRFPLLRNQIGSKYFVERHNQFIRLRNALSFIVYVECTEESTIVVPCVDRSM